jgi:hypothetical protein
MPRPDLAELFASKLDRLPTPDGRELRFLHYSTFGQADDVKARIAEMAKDVGAAFVHLAESHGYRFSHPTDPEPEMPSGKRIAHLVCPHCEQTIAGLPLDENDRLTPNVHQAVALKLIGEHACLNNPL